MCSSKVHRLIRLSNLKVGTINYRTNGNYLNIANNVNADDGNDVEVNFDYADEAQVENIPRFKDEDDTMDVTIGGITIKCTSKFKWTCYTFQYLDTHRDKLPLALYNHTQSMFPKSSKAVELEIFIWSNPLPSLPTFQGVTDIQIGDMASLKADELEEFLLLYPKRRSLSIMGKVNGSFAPDSKVFETENVFLKRSQHIAPLFLRNFSGCSVFLHDAICDANTIMDFLKDWIRGEKYHNLEALCLEVNVPNGYYPEPFLDVQSIVKKIDPSQRPQQFKYEPKIIDFYSDDIFRRVDMDIERETDGMMASFGVDHEYFRFYVWNRNFGNS